jgi:hypothetical protein
VCVPGSCKQDGDSCQDPAECCGGYCNYNYNLGTYSCDHVSNCYPSGIACSLNSECCSGYCTGTCY